MKLRSAKEGATLVPAAERRSDCGGRKDQLRRIRERPKTQVGGEGPAFKGNFVTLKVAQKQILKKDQYGTVESVNSKLGFVTNFFFKLNVQKIHVFQLFSDHYKKKIKDEGAKMTVIFRLH